MAETTRSMSASPPQHTSWIGAHPPVPLWRPVDENERAGQPRPAGEPGPGGSTPLQ